MGRQRFEVPAKKESYDTSETRPDMLLGQASVAVSVSCMTRSKMITVSFISWVRQMFSWPFHVIGHVIRLVGACAR